MVAEDVLAFAGIAPPTLRLYPIETHIAEKLHAYTMPRARPNSRVKDLPDLALLGDRAVHRREASASGPRADLHVPQDARATCEIPEPLGAWTTPYAAMAREDQLAWLTLDEVTKAAQGVPRPRPRRRARCDVGSRDVELATSLIEPLHCRQSPA